MRYGTDPRSIFSESSIQKIRTRTPEEILKALKEKKEGGIKILFLGYLECRVLDFLSETNDVFQTMKPIKDKVLKRFDLAISFGYRFIIRPQALAYAPRPPINLHISFLPYNRGADPNYWSFYDDTPKGVTIHEMDEGVDSGDILFQKEIVFTEHEDDLALTYQRLFNEVQELFIKNWGQLRYGALCYFLRTPQPAGGNHHDVGEMPELEDGWETKVKTIRRTER